MANMILDGYTFARQPNEPLDVIKKIRDIAYIETHSAIDAYSWGCRYYGVIIPLIWNLMPVAQFDTLYTKELADEEIVFDPNDDSGITFNVQILSLNGKYLVHLDDDATMRKDVVLRLLIINEVS